MFLYPPQNSTMAQYTELDKKVCPVGSVIPPAGTVARSRNLEQTLYAWNLTGMSLHYSVSSTTRCLRPRCTCGRSDCSEGHKNTIDAKHINNTTVFFKVDMKSTERLWAKSRPKSLRVSEWICSLSQMFHFHFTILPLSSAESPTWPDMMMAMGGQFIPESSTVKLSCQSMLSHFF